MAKTKKSKSSKKNMIPEKRDALTKFKYEVAAEVGVNLKEGYNGDLTTKQAGTVGGNMVKKMLEKSEYKK